jgi:predicted nuclease of predicted toxin-antitoxin system
VRDEGLTGRPDQDGWSATQADRRFLITQDLDFADNRRFAPGSHMGVLLVRLREPGANAILESVKGVADQFVQWDGAFVVLTDRKLRIKRP